MQDQATFWAFEFPFVERHTDNGLATAASITSVQNPSELRQWSVQLSLLPPKAHFFNDSDLLISADCVAYANPNFHQNLLKGKTIVIGCPKLDSIELYEDKLTEIFKQNNVKSATVAIMEVPCCRGMHVAVENAIQNSGRNIHINKVIVRISGEIE